MPTLTAEQAHFGPHERGGRGGRYVPSKAGVNMERIIATSRVKVGDAVVLRLGRRGTRYGIVTHIRSYGVPYIRVDLVLVRGPEAYTRLAHGVGSNYHPHFVHPINSPEEDSNG